MRSPSSLPINLVTSRTLFRLARHSVSVFQYTTYTQLFGSLYSRGIDVNSRKACFFYGLYIDLAILLLSYVPFSQALAALCGTYKGDEIGPESPPIPPWNQPKGAMFDESSFRRRLKCQPTTVCVDLQNFASAARTRTMRKIFFRKGGRLAKCDQRITLAVGRVRHCVNCFRRMLQYSALGTLTKTGTGLDCQDLRGPFAVLVAQQP